MLGRGQRAFVGAVVVMTVASGLAAAEEQSPPATQPPAAQEAAAPQQPTAPQDTAAQQAATPASDGKSAPPAIQPESSPPSQQQGVVAHVDPSPAAEAPPVNPSEPDPLTPAEVVTPPPAAPGAAPAAAVAQKPAAELNPVIVEARRKLAAEAKAGNAGERDDRAGLAAFYEARAGEPVWAGADGFTQRAKQAMDEIRRADQWGLNPSAFALPEAAAAGASAEALADVEIKVGLAVLKYARHARGGRLDPNAISRIIDQKPQVYDPRSVMDAIAAYDGADAYLRSLHPKHPQFEKLRQALLAARRDGEAGADAADIKKGSAKLGKSESTQRILVNMERWRWLPDNLGSFYVWDSVPEQMTRVYKGDQVVLSEKIVVGKPTSPTFLFSADMQYVIFHPSWGVPAGIKSFELAPLLRKYSDGGGFWIFKSTGASDVLRAQKLTMTRNGVPVDPDLVDWKSADISQYHFEQAAGATNVLGVVKFRFPNKYDIYMHDTPERHLFGGSIRAFSHGCMRVQNPVHLAEVLLAHDKGWSAEKVRGFVSHGGAGEVKLDKPIPVHITYFTATVDDAGKVNYHSDIYGLDGRIASALEGRQVHIAATAAPVSTQKVSADLADTPSSGTVQRKPRPARAVAAAATTEDGAPIAKPAKEKKYGYRSAKKDKKAAEPKSTSIFDW